MKVSRLIAMAAVIAGVSSTLNAQTSSGRIGPSGAEVAGAVIGAGAVVAVVVVVVVKHGHQAVTGCVVSATSGLELQTADAKTYMLVDDAASLKAGERVKIRVSKVKRAKGAAGPDVLKVEKLNKDYGACHAEGAPAPGGAL